MTAKPVGDAPRLEMQGVCKRFGATVALADVALRLAPGRVHALLGENGAGKSTLMKVLSGAVRPDSGRMRLDGKTYQPRGPLAARAAGVAMIYQELNLAPHLTVEQNLTLGIETQRFGVIRRRAQRARVLDSLARLERRDIRPQTRVAHLPPAARQLVEIARALMTDARVIVMDEPTSSLGAGDIEHLFGVIDTLRSDGVAIVYISHFLEETQRIADDYTVLRDGRVAGSGAMVDATVAALIEQMIGRRLDEMFPRVPHTVGPPLLELRALAGARLPLDATLTLHRGEVLGLAGLVGAGRTELLRALFGLDAVRRGEVRIGTDARASAGDDPATRLAQGVGLLSEDRATEGLACARSISENLTLSRLAPYSRWGWLRRGALRRAAAQRSAQLRIVCRGVEQAVGELSGGNQQKVALARLLHHDVDVLLLDEPTRGVDVASKAQIYTLIGELAARGKAVLVVSSYMPELLGICDRIAVMHRGRLGPARVVEEWTEHRLITTATSGRDHVA
ncbi:MAG: sugar ABC transporter ATP-binding protein [Phycisphaerae bacterium]